MSLAKGNRSPSVSSEEGGQRPLAKERAHETSEKAPPTVQVKADRNGFTLVPDPAASLDAIVAFMDERLEQSRDFFQKTEMVLDLRTRPMRTDEISVLYEKLYEKSKVKVVEVRLSDELSFSMAGEGRKSRFGSKGARPGPSKTTLPSLSAIHAGRACGSSLHRTVSSWET